MDIPIERRVFERLPARFPTKFHDSSGDYGDDVFLRDMSATGVRITTKDKLFLNDVVSIDVKLPDGQAPVSLNGRVCWVRGVTPRVFEAGVEFHKVNFVRISRLTKYALALSEN
ncbi:MAG: PilZ domain-containing protein [Candidatus Omnitrophica bacterium]|nr:PilZ domain-containing protein [Candidatus Omnitrophota bacterium]